jgi:hypothetical protein
VGTPAASAFTERLSRLTERGSALEAEGLPFPTQQVRSAVESALSQGSVDEAANLLKRGESLYTVAARDWGWVRETLTRADELRELAAKIGLDVDHLDSRVGNPRQQLKTQTLSAASLGRAAASASLAVAVLHDAIPKFCVQESQKLGLSIRAARNRGEDVTEAVRWFSKLLQAIQDVHIVQTATLLVDVRRAVARIPRAPAMSVPSEEEEEILMEARNLARRLHRIKSKARNAQSAARLMTQVRAALSEERRFGTPEEEIEALWNEVDQLTRERGLPARPPEPTEVPDGESTDDGAPDEPLPANGADPVETTVPFGNSAKNARKSTP